MNTKNFGLIAIVIFILSIAGCKSEDSIVTPITEGSKPPNAPSNPNPSNGQLNVYPNPGKGMLDVIFNLERGKKGTIVITDLQGRTIYQRSVIGQGNNKERINLVNRSSGMLYLQLKTSKGTEVKKIIIAR